MPNKTASGAQPAPAADKGRSKLLDMLDTLAKLLAAGAVVFGAFIANSYQSKMTAITVLSQREQAESELRATMFSNLISPIAGPGAKDRDISPERLKLLTELLALNFHEHFEFKPLLEFVDENLKSDEDRRSLRSIARRVTERQVASLLNGGGKEDRTRVYQLAFIRKHYDRENAPVDIRDYLKANEDAREFGDYIECPSPDGKWTLLVTIEKLVEDKKQSLPKMYVIIRSNLTGKDREEIKDIVKDFTLTYFDFPVTDNSLLADGNRFSLVLDDIDEEQVKLKLIWFPKNYFTARERPVNYNMVLENLGLKPPVQKEEAKAKQDRP